MTVEFGTLDFNNLVLLGIAVIGLFNTVLTLIGNKTAKETKDIAKKTEANTSAEKEERERMSALFEEALGSMKKVKHK